MMRTPPLRHGRLLRAGAAGALAALLTLSGCGSSDSGDGKTTIRFSWWGDDGRAAVTKAVLADFEKKHPDIEVDTETSDVASYFDRLATQTAAGDAPDLMTLGGAYLREYGERGALLDLKTVSDSLDLSKFPPSTLSAATFEGTRYGAPTGAHAVAMVVNPAVFKAAGVPLPDTRTWTWDQFVDTANRISRNSPKGTYGFEPRAVDTLGAYSGQRGTPLFTTRGGLGVRASTVEDYFSMEEDLLEGGGMPSAETIQEVAAAAPEQTLMGRGKAAMSIAYSNLLGSYDKAVGGGLQLVGIPGEKQYEQPGTTVQPSQYYAISAKSAHPDAAAQLLDYLVNSAAAGRKILDDRGLPYNPDVRKAVSASLDASGRADADFVDQVAHNGAPAAPDPPAGGSSFNDVTSKLDSDVLFGRKSAAAAAEEWVSRMKQALDPA